MQDASNRKELNGLRTADYSPNSRIFFFRGLAPPHTVRTACCFVDPALGAWSTSCVGLVVEGRNGGSDALSFEAAACIPDVPHTSTRNRR
jgi:hypothetical protein